MGELSIQQKKDYAKTLYLADLTITQKEVAKRADVAEKTVSNWVNKEGWENLRTSLLTTRETQLSHLYNQLRFLNEAIANRENKYAAPKEADVLAKLTASINKLEQDLSISEIVNVFKKLLDWLRKVDLEKAKEMSALLDAFIKDQIR